MSEDARSPGSVGIFSFKYSRRIVAILIAAVGAAAIVRSFLVPKGFGEFGHYRGAAPGEVAALTPVFQGKQACGACHAAEFERHEKDVHVNVQCEDCHGPGEAHVAARRAHAPAEQGHIFRELEQSNCLACHRRLVARPKLFPTIEVAEHFALVGVKDPKTTCQSCHDPHQPLFLERPVSQARKHPLIHPCSDCHADRAVEQRPMPAGHVVTFQCADCHAEIAADFKTRKHAFLDCRACHNFHKESEFSGAIFKNGNPRLCLMCHQAAPFKNEKVPKIESFEAHRADVAGEGDEQKRCADCHLAKRIHRLPEKAAATRAP
jgi:predicted CXXCH cytochrome family protein